MNYEIIGWVGSFFYAICFFPQIYGIYKTQSPELSINFMYFQLGGATSMFTYGLLKKLYPIMCLNAFAWICILFIICGMYKNKNNLNNRL
jgi:uncharacterized protein with PQ loop repeat